MTYEDLSEEQKQKLNDAAFEIGTDVFRLIDAIKINIEMCKHDSSLMPGRFDNWFTVD